jgi:hypothetical protein
LNPYFRAWIRFGARKQPEPVRRYAKRLRGSRQNIRESAYLASPQSAATVFQDSVPLAPGLRCFTASPNYFRASNDGRLVSSCREKSLASHRPHIAGYGASHGEHAANRHGRLSQGHSFSVYRSRRYGLIPPSVSTSTLRHSKSVSSCQKPRDLIDFCPHPSGPRYRCRCQVCHRRAPPNQTLVGRARRVMPLFAAPLPDTHLANPRYARDHDNCFTPTASRPTT